MIIFGSLITLFAFAYNALKFIAVILVILCCLKYLKD